MSRFNVSLPRTIALLAATALVALAAPTGALAWQLPATNLSEAGENASAPQVAVAPDGTTAVTWIRPDSNSDDRVQVAIRAAGQATFGAVQTVSPANESADKPQVAIGSDGTVTAAWRNISHYTIQTATRLAGEPTFSAAQDLSTPDGTNDVSVIIAPNGTATAMWDKFVGPIGSSYSLIQTASRPAGQATFGSTQDVTASGADAFYPQLAADEDSNVTAVWTRDTGVGVNAVQTATKGALQANFGSAQTISVPGSTSDQDIVVAPDGAAVATWVRQNNSGNLIVQATIRNAGSNSFGSVLDLSPVGQDSRTPQVAIAPDGQATVVWNGSNTGLPVVQAVTRAPGQATFGAPQGLSATGRTADGQRIAVAPDGTTTVVWWRQSEATNKLVVQASTRNSGESGFSAPQDLSQADNNAELAPTPVGVSANGTAIAVWAWDDGSNYRVQASTNGPVTRPVTTSTTGAGTVSSSPAGISCGATCSAPFALLSSVTLTATPDPGASFIGWGGDCSGTSATCALSILGARSATATFTDPPAPAPTPVPGPNPGPSPEPKPSASATVTSAAPSVTAKEVAINSRVQVSGAGKLEQRATTGTRKLKTWCRVSKTVPAAGTHTIKCNLGSSGRKALRKGSLALTLRTTFTPTSGTAVTATRAVTIKRKR